MLLLFNKLFQCLTPPAAIPKQGVSERNARANFFNDFAHFDCISCHTREDLARIHGGTSLLLHWWLPLANVYRRHVAAGVIGSELNALGTEQSRTSKRGTRAWFSQQQEDSTAVLIDTVL